MGLLKTNTKAPNFSLKDKDDQTYALYDDKSDFSVLYFYPRDSTPGCTLEAKGFTKYAKVLKELGANIVGISGGDSASKRTFCRKHKLKVLLLSDSEFKVSKKYKAYGKKSFMGHIYTGVSRVTYVLDKNKKIIKVYEKVNPLSHAKDVLLYLRSLQNPL
jgi:peroxiredoxin Q/BCP